MNKYTVVLNDSSTVDVEAEYVDYAGGDGRLSFSKQGEWIEPRGAARNNALAGYPNEGYHRIEQVAGFSKDTWQRYFLVEPKEAN